MRPIAHIFSKQQCLVVPYKNPANHTPEVQIGHAKVFLSSHRQTMGKRIGNFSKATRPKIQTRDLELIELLN